MPKIIISYRRADSLDIAMRIRDQLVARYGPNSVFTDIDSIPLGLDFLQAINDEIENSDALIAIVGPRWLDAKSETGEAMTERDFVRIEVEAALKRKIPVVPLVTSGARMPTTAELPETMRSFAFKHGMTVDSGVNFRHDIDRLIQSLDRHFPDAPKKAEQVTTDSKPRTPASKDETNKVGNKVGKVFFWLMVGLFLVVLISLFRGRL